MDLSFDGDGRLALAGFGEAADVRALPDGRIRVVASFMEDGARVPCVIGLLNSGAIDVTYATNGIYTIQDAPLTPYELIYVDDSLCYAYWRNDSILFLAKHDGFGARDAGYGVTGIASVHPGSTFGLTRVIATPAGSILATGWRMRWANSGFPVYQPWEVQDGFVARIGSQGSMDSTFNGGGFVFQFSESPNERLSVVDIALLPHGEMGVMCNYAFPSFPGNNVFARKLDSSGGGGEIIPVFSGMGGNYPGAIFSSPNGSLLTTAFSHWYEPFVGWQQRTAVPSETNGGNTTYVEWLSDNIEGLGGGEVLTATSDWNASFIIAGKLIGDYLPSTWFCAKIPQVGAGFIQPFGIDGFASVEWIGASQSRINASCSQSDGRFLLAGHAVMGDAEACVLARFHNIPDPRSKLSLRMHLGGAYDAGTGLMRDDLREQGLLPSLPPFDPIHFHMVNGVGSRGMPQHVIQTEGDSAVVDWVWLELLDATDTTTTIATRVGLVHRNGWVTSADGHSPIDFSAGAGTYFVRARHRNHLGVTCSQAQTLGSAVTTLDLTDPVTPTFGTNAQMETGGVHMLWPGDVNSDGLVKYAGGYNDRDPILVAVGGNTPLAVLPGYRTEDVNMDGVVKYVGPANDRDAVLQVLGGDPFGIRVEQRP